MPELRIPGAAALAAALGDGEMRVLTAGDTEILLLRDAGTLIATQSKCPHAGAPLVEGAVCNHRLVCPWHMGTFALPSGALLEPPPLQGLQTYTIREAGADLLFNPVPLPAPMPQSSTDHDIIDDTRTFVLIGVGAAGTAAATTLRREGFTGRLIAIDPVPDEPVDRTQLSKQALAGKLPLDKLPLDAFADLNLERRTAAVTSLSAARRQLTLSDGTSLGFDAALVATGGRPKRLKLPGGDTPFTLRHTEDVRQILATAAEGKHALIVGTSFIGLEAASALTQKGLRVTVVGHDPLPFAKKFGDRVAHALVALHQSKGVTFRLGVEITQLSATTVDFTTEGKPEQVAGDLVLLGVGVSPTLDFEHDLPLASSRADTPNGSIATDASLLAAPSVWVAGDIASVSGTRIEHWRLAEQHGATAARAMLGSPDPFTGVPFFWTFHFGKRLGYLGHAAKWDHILYAGSVEDLTFLAFYIQTRTVAAVLSCGRDHDTATLAELLRQPLPVANIQQRFGAN